MEELSIFIPYSTMEVTDNQIEAEMKHLGVNTTDSVVVKRIDRVKKYDDTDGAYESLYVHLQIRGNRSQVFADIRDGKSVKVTYNFTEGKYWNLLLNKSKKRILGQRKIRIQLDDEQAYKKPALVYPETPYPIAPALGGRIPIKIEIPTDLEEGEVV